MYEMIYRLDHDFLSLLYAKLLYSNLGCLHHWWDCICPLTLPALEFEAKPAWELYMEELAGSLEDTQEGLDMEVQEELELDGTELKVW